ncbi:MAG TPA: hypothetical protein VMR96_08125, partial [Solirubrobacterales bacterium]|nr:hypothetical protein [Solirubrobacterales bacterium]
QDQIYGGEGQFFRGALGGAFGPLSPLLVPIDNSGSKDLQFSDGITGSLGSAADLSATVFRAPQASTAFLPGDPHDPNGPYLAYLDAQGDASLALLSRDEDGKVWGGRCAGSDLGGTEALNQGAISSDGSRIYFTTRPAQPGPSAEEEANGEFPACVNSNPQRILKRTEAPSGDATIEELVPGGPAADDDLYQGASDDGSRVYFLTARKLVPEDLDEGAEGCSAEIGASKGCDLYLFDSARPPAERITMVSEGAAGDPTPGKGANVLGSITSISTDGTHVYFTAQGVLSDDANPIGVSAVAGQPNLYLYETASGSTSFLGTLAPGDRTVLWGSNQTLRAAYPVPLLGPGGLGGDGHILFFLSRASLTAEDADGGRTDAYRYDSDGETLRCVSCAPGGPDAQPYDVEANMKPNALSPLFTEQGRWASEDGETVAFSTAEPLVAGDEDGTANPYLWREGELFKLPGRVPGPSQLPVVSAGGEEVGFSTSAALLPQDGDTARDAYLVRTGGGFVNPISPLSCDPLTEGSCQGPASSRPASPPASTDSFVGPGNSAQAPTCAKGRVRRKGKCVAAHKRKKAQHKRAGHKRKGIR